MDYSTATSFIERHGLNMQLFGEDGEGEGTVIVEEPIIDPSIDIDVGETEPTPEPVEEPVEPSDIELEVNGEVQTYTPKQLTDMVNNYTPLQTQYTQGQQERSELQKKIKELESTKVEAPPVVNDKPDFSGDPDLEKVYNALSAKMDSRDIRDKEKDEALGKLQSELASIKGNVQDKNDWEMINQSFSSIETKLDRKLSPKEKDNMLEMASKGNYLQMAADSMFVNELANAKAGDMQERLALLRDHRSQVGSKGQKGATSKSLPDGAESIIDDLGITEEQYLSKMKA